MVFFVLSFILFVFINNLFLQTKTTYKSKAQEISPTPTPHYLTSDPKKILEYWLRNRKPTILDENSVHRIIIKDFTKSIPELSSMKYIGDLRFNEDYSSQTSPGCNPIFSTITEPFGILLREVARSMDEYNDSLSEHPYSSLSFFESGNQREISILLTAWSGGGTKIDAIRYFPYKTIVNAFSSMLFEDGQPMVNENMTIDGCSSPNYERWLRWATFLILDPEAINIPLNNTQTLLQERSADRYQNSVNVKAFIEELKASYKISYPEIVLYPLVTDDLKLSRVDGRFATIYNQSEIWSYSDERPRHLTFHFDKCPEGPTGHFYQMLNVVLPALHEGIKADGTGQLTDKTWKENTIFVLSGKSFLNLPLNRDALKYLGTCNTDVNGGFGGAKACPNVDKEIVITKENSVFVTFKTVNDRSCKYLIPKIPGVTGRDFFEDYSGKDMTFLLYLGTFGKQGKDIAPHDRP